MMLFKVDVFGFNKLYFVFVLVFDNGDKVVMHAWEDLLSAHLPVGP